MGQPITLVKGTEQMTVYGQAQAAVHCLDGWSVMGSSMTTDQPSEPITEPTKQTAVTKRGKAKAG